MQATATRPAAEKSVHQPHVKHAGDWWGIFKQSISDWSADRATKLSAALAFYTMLSIAPLLVIAIKIVGKMFGDKVVNGQVRTYLEQLMGHKAADAVQDMIRAAAQPGNGVVATIISAVVLVFSAAGVFGELQDSLNIIWRVKPKPNRGIWDTIRDRFFSLALVLGTAFLLMVSLIASTAIAAVTKAIGGGNGGVPLEILNFVLTFGITTVLFALIFKYLPDVKVRWKDVWIGGLVTAVLFTIGKFILGWYLGRAATTSVYGAFGSLVAMLLWVYYSAQILFFGAELTRVYAQRTGHAVPASDNAVKVTSDERAAQGMVSDEHLAAAVARQEGRPVRARLAAPARPPRPRPAPVSSACEADGSRTAKDAAFAAGGLVLGAALGAIGVEYLLHDPNKPTSRQAAAVKLDERLHKIERKLGSVSRIKDYLEEMDVTERIDRVEKEVRRAGTHVRAQETGRPTWMVRLADAIGGRWSNL